MVWIDGDHTYGAVKQDFVDWFQRLEIGGWLALHDTVNNWQGPTKLTRELLGHRSDLTEIGVVMLTLFGRKAHPRLGNRVAAGMARLSFELLTLMQARHAGFAKGGLSRRALVWGCGCARRSRRTSCPMTDLEVAHVFGMRLVETEGLGESTRSRRSLWGRSS